MPPRTEVLDTFATVVLDGSGNGVASIQPTALETWTVTTIAVHVSSNTAEPTAQVYVGTQAPGSLIGSTYTGSLDSSDGTWQVNPNQPIICAWAGGDAGATATMSLLGTILYRS